MRLSVVQRHLLQDTVQRHFGAEVAACTLGSRIDDAASGGDVNVFVDTPTHADYRVRVRAMALAQREALLASPVDLVVKDVEDRERPIHRIARLTGVRLP